MTPLPLKDPDSRTSFNAGIRKMFLYAMIFFMIGMVSLYIKKMNTVELPPEEPAVAISDEIAEDRMSAIRLTTLPFILAFKHLVADREE